MLNRFKTSLGNYLVYMRSRLRDRNFLNMTNYFLTIAKKLNANTSIEVGAHSAEFSKSIIEIHKFSHVHAFEANPYVFKKFVTDMPKEIKYLNLAIANLDGSVDFHFKNLKTLTGESSSILKRNSYSDLNHLVSVKSAKLDTLFPKKPTNILWIDVEGANKEVLMGGVKLLCNTEAIFIELEHIQIWKNQWTSRNVHQFLVSNGFSLILINLQGPHQSNAIYLKSRNLTFLQLIILKPISCLKLFAFEKLKLYK